MDRFVVLLAGPIHPCATLHEALSGRRVIAADGGIAHAAALGLAPELWIGDFDSAGKTDASSFAHVARHPLPRDKDKTDGEAAIEAALERGARDLLLVGALGGRTDHAFSNLVLALRTARTGVRIELFDGRERAIPLTREGVRLDTPPGRAFSILRFSDVRGLTVRGAKWPLDREALPFHSILTQSNETLGPIEASLESGEALLLLQEAGD